ADDGSFTLDDLEEGTYTVWARHTGFAEAEVSQVHAGADAIAIRLPSQALVAGVVTDSAGVPVSDFKVSLVPTSEQSEPRGFHDVLGRFEIGALAAGTYVAEVQATDGRASETQSITLSEGAQMRNLRFVIASGVTVRGRIIDGASGEPVAGA